MKTNPSSPFSPIQTDRVWGYQELAICYFPHIKPQSASNQLRRWINYSPELLEKLAGCHWVPGRKILTPRQVRCIVDHLGEP